jgi:hypothetical protein
MIDIEDIWRVITDAGFALTREGEYDHNKLQSYCRRLQHNVDYRYSSFELNANGRRACAQDASIWEALRCSLNPDFWENFYSTQRRLMYYTTYFFSASFFSPVNRIPTMAMETQICIVSL